MFFRLLILNKKYLLCALENEKTRSTFTNFFLFIYNYYCFWKKYMEYCVIIPYMYSMYKLSG